MMFDAAPTDQEWENKPLDEHMCHSACKDHGQEPEKKSPVPQKMAVPLKNLSEEQHIVAGAYYGDSMYFNLFLNACALGSAYKFYKSIGDDKPNVKWGMSTAVFYTAQFLESFTSTTYECLDHVVDTQHAIDDLECFKKRAPKVDVSITNFHWETYIDKTQAPPRLESRKVITGGETRNFKFTKWNDNSAATEFLKDCKGHEHKEKLKPMTRLIVKTDVQFSPEAEKRFNEERKELYLDNHTKVPHDMYIFPRDVKH